MVGNIQFNSKAKKISPLIIERLETIIDPEIELDIYNLGLIYQIDLSEEGLCQIMMTFTSAGCGCIGTVPQEMKEQLVTIPEIEEVAVEVVWQPSWNLTRISRVGRVSLGVNPN